MILLVSGATLSGRRYLGHPHFGWLKTPANRNSVRAITDAGVPWACDNDCYVRLDRVAYLKMLRRIAGQPGLLWVTAPDVVADAGATLARFRIWRSALDYYGLPIAFVAQDGQESRPVPWEAIRCLFVGGSTGWKEGPHAARLIRRLAREGVTAAAMRARSGAPRPTDRPAREPPRRSRSSRSCAGSSRSRRR